MANWKDHKKALRDQLQEKAKLATLLEERNRSLEREQRKANKAMQELVINFGHLAYEMNEKKKMEQKEKLKNGWKKETKRIYCVYGTSLGRCPCHVCEGKLGAHWDKPCSYRKQIASIVWDKTMKMKGSITQKRPQSLVAVKIMFGPFCSVNITVCIDGPEPAV